MSNLTQYYKLIIPNIGSIIRFFAFSKKIIILPVFLLLALGTHGQSQVEFLVDSLNNLSYSNRRSNPKLSLLYALEAIELSSNIKYSKGKATGIHNRGTAKAILGQMDQSLKDLMEAARLREELNDIEGLSTTYNNIGFVFSEIGNDKKALEFYTKSLEFHRQSANNTNIGVVLNNIGWVNLRSKKFDLSLEYFYLALNANEEHKDERGAGASLGNIGTVYNKMGEHAKALEYHKKALKIVESYSDKIGETSINLFIADDYLSLEQYDNAIAYAKKSLAMAQEIGYIADEKNAAAKLAEIFEVRGRFEESTKYLKLVAKLNDSLFNIDRAEAIGKIESVYEIEIQQKENQMLKREQVLNREIIDLQLIFLYLLIGVIILVSILSISLYTSRKKMKESNILLQKLNKESNYHKEIIQIKIEELNEKNAELTDINSIKDKLISVIAHDLKNPLHAIAGYAEVILNRANEGFTKETLSYLRIIHDNSIRGNLLLDNLLQWSRFQTRTLPFNPSTVSIKEIVKDELYLIQPIANEKQIEIRTNFDSKLSVFADSNMLRTIIRNLIANSIKFTKTGGFVKIDAVAKGKIVEFSITDNGIGIEPQLRSKLFSREAGISTTGTSGEKGTGLGLMICKDFVERHEGEIWFESQPGNGTIFYFTIPLPSEIS